MSDRIPISYGEFHDFPRQIRFQFGTEWFYLSSSFDEAMDDYLDYYDVYLLPYRTEEEFKANPYYWTNLSNSQRLGKIPIAELGLDNTRRKSIDAHVFGKWLRLHRATD